MKRVVVFTATRWERNAVRRAVCVERSEKVGGVRWLVGYRGGARLYLIQTEMGPDRAQAISREVFRRLPVDFAMSSGFACALVPPSRVGDVLIGTTVIAYTGLESGANLTEAPGESALKPFSCFAAASALACRAAEGAGLAPRTGGFVTVPRVLWRATDKRMVASRTGAIGLDMESAAIGAAAAEYQVPFVIVRAVSDLVDEDLPLDFSRLRGPAGWGRGLVALLARPSCVIELRRLYGQVSVAANHLTRFFGKFFDALD